MTCTYMLVGQGLKRLVLPLLLFHVFLLLLQLPIDIHTEYKVTAMNTIYIQWTLSIKDTLNKGHLSNEDTVCSPNHIELCRNLPLN